MCCINIGGYLEQSVFIASSLDIKMVENGSEIEGPSRHRMTSKKLNIMETDFEKIRCDGY